MKEPVSKFNMDAAFKALDEIDIPAVKGGILAESVEKAEKMKVAPNTDILCEEYYDVNNYNDVDKAIEEREAEVAKAKLARIEKIVDLDAETEEDILPSYVGKMIIQCPQCMTLFYKNPEDIEYSEENPDVVNLNEICQHCGNSSGYTLVGKVGEVNEDEAAKYDATEAGIGTEEAPIEETAAPAEEQPIEPAQEEAPAEEPAKEEEAVETAETTEELPELPELPEDEEEEDKKKEESLNASEAQKDAEEGSDLATENKSENLTLNEEANVEESLNNSEAQKDAAENSELATENASENKTLNEEAVDESLNKSEAQEDAAENSELATDNASENATLNEEVDLKDYNAYIEYLNKQIEQEEEALAKATNKLVKDAIQRRIDSFKADLEDALPNIVKDEEAAKELPTAEEAGIDAAENIEEPKEEGTPKTESLTESLDDKIEALINDTEDDNADEEELTQEEIIDAVKNGEEINVDAIKEELTIRADLEDVYKPWQGAVDTWEKIKEAEKVEDLELYLSEIFPDGMTVTQINDTLWFNGEDVLDYLGIEKKVEESVEADKVATEVLDEIDAEDKTLTEASDEGITNKEADELLNSAEFQTPISETEVEHYLNEGEKIANAIKENIEAEKEILDPIETKVEINDFFDKLDDASIEECVAKTLKEVYENVKGFKLANKTLTEDKQVIVEGTINFESGKSRNTKYTFKECVCNQEPDAIVITLTGVNNDLDSDGVFVLNCKGNEDAGIMAESMSYNYHIGEDLVEGLVK